MHQHGDRDRDAFPVLVLVLKAQATYWYSIAANSRSPRVLGTGTGEVEYRNSWYKPIPKSHYIIVDSTTGGKAICDLFTICRENATFG